MNLNYRLNFNDSEPEARKQDNLKFSTARPQQIGDHKMKDYHKNNSTFAISAQFFNVKIIQ